MIVWGRESSGGGGDDKVLEEMEMEMMVTKQR